jgi:4-hydroxybenzoyl-CoA reductase subunit beta
MSAMPAAFDFARPASLAELQALLETCAASGREVALAAGATDLMPQLKQGLRRPELLISLGGLPGLCGVSAVTSGGLRIGALTPLADLASDARIMASLPALAQAAARVASGPIRQRATLGGNLLVDTRCSFYNQSPVNRAAHGACFKAGGAVCHIVKSAVLGQLPQCQARFVSDTAPVLLLADAVLQLASPRGERRLPLAGFYRHDGMDRNQLAADELLLAIEIPAIAGLAIDYAKLAIRNTLDFPSLGIALGLCREGETPIELRLAMTGIGPRPGHWRFALADFATPAAALDAAITAAREHNAVYDQDFFPRDYRKRMIEVFVRRAAQRLGGGAWM